jgi:hypothetical protein
MFYLVDLANDGRHREIDLMLESLKRLHWSEEDLSWLLGQTMMSAAMAGRSELAQKMITYGASLTYDSRFLGNSGCLGGTREKSILEIACEAGQLELVEYLIARGFKVDISR